jgi:cobalt-zinc-cadmium efflux system protein
VNKAQFSEPPSHVCSDPNHGSHEHNHAHHHHRPARYGKVFALALGLNGSFVVIELVFGLLANSIALVADAGHNLSDVLGLVLAWIAHELCRREPSSQKTYGWRKSSIVAAFLNAIFLVLVTGGIAWEALQRLMSPDALQGKTMIIVAAIGIVINTSTALLFMRDRHHDLNLKAAFSHMVADAMVSLGVVIAGIGIVLSHWLWLDPAFSLVISGVIIFNTWALLTESFHLVLDGVPAKIDEQAVRFYLSERPGVKQVHDLHIWGISTTEIALTAHLVIPTGHPGDAFLAETCQGLHHHFGIDHATLQVEIEDSAHSCSHLFTEV